MRKTLKGRKQTNKYGRRTERHLPKTDNIAERILANMKTLIQKPEYTDLGMTFVLYPENRTTPNF